MRPPPPGPPGRVAVQVGRGAYVSRGPKEKCYQNHVAAWPQGSRFRIRLVKQDGKTVSQLVQGTLGDRV